MAYEGGAGHSPPGSHSLDFERPILELENKIAELRRLAMVQEISVDDEVKKLTEKAKKLRKEIYSKLTAWQHVQLARHPLRPYALDYIQNVFTDFEELARVISVGQGG